jgi:hypothetical protein
MNRLTLPWIRLVIVTLLIFVTTEYQCNAFTSLSPHQRPGDVLTGSTIGNTVTSTRATKRTSLAVFGGNNSNKKKNVKDDETEPMFTDTRGMTRDEMLEYNRQSEKTMNVEFVGMTVFSLVISAPLLYLAWVGLFSETNEISGTF